MDKFDLPFCFNRYTLLSHGFHDAMSEEVIPYPLIADLHDYGHLPIRESQALYIIDRRLGPTAFKSPAELDFTIVNMLHMAGPPQTGIVFNKEIVAIRSYGCDAGNGANFYRVANYPTLCVDRENGRIFCTRRGMLDVGPKGIVDFVFNTSSNDVDRVNVNTLIALSRAYDENVDYSKNPAVFGMYPLRLPDSGRSVEGFDGLQTPAEIRGIKHLFDIWMEEAQSAPIALKTEPRTCLEDFYSFLPNLSLSADADYDTLSVRSGTSLYHVWSTLPYFFFPKGGEKYVKFDGVIDALVTLQPENVQDVVDAMLCLTHALDDGEATVPDIAMFDTEMGNGVLIKECYFADYMSQFHGDKKARPVDK